jgi:hypothetical protein
LRSVDLLQSLCRPASPFSEFAATRAKQRTAAHTFPDAVLAVPVYRAVLRGHFDRHARHPLSKILDHRQLRVHRGAETVFRNAIIHLPHRKYSSGQVVVALEDRGTLLQRKMGAKLPVDPLRTKFHPQPHVAHPPLRLITSIDVIGSATLRHLEEIYRGPFGSREPNLGCRCVSKRNRISES